MMADMSDAYIFWRITEGGVEAPFNSAMPAWGDAYSTDQIWQLVSFLRTFAE
jgi:mono/diheme cytochrome c family protein